MKIKNCRLCLIMMLTMAMWFYLSAPALAQSDITVFAAASTTNAVTDISAAFEKQQDRHVVLSFASSSTLAKQIASGAPADIYISANKKWMDFLEEKNLIDKKSRFDLLGNRIVLIVPSQSTLKHVDVTQGFSIAALLGDDGRLSIGDPNHVPAGMYGKKALQTQDVWGQVEHRLAPMKDVRAALVLVERGETPLGIVYSTDAAISHKVRIVGTFPNDSHPAIVYPVATIFKKDTEDTDAFLKFLKSPEAKTIFEKYGFSVR